MCINLYDTIPIFHNIWWTELTRVGYQGKLHNSMVIPHIAWGQGNHTRTFIGFTDRGKKQESIAKVNTTRYRGGTLV